MSANLTNTAYAGTILENSPDHSNEIKFHYADASITPYNPTGYLGRKITALPCAAFGLIKTTYHFALALISTVHVFRRDTTPLKVYLFCCVRDLEESLGRLVTVIHDRWGSSLVQESTFQKERYFRALKEKYHSTSSENSGVKKTPPNDPKAIPENKPNDPSSTEPPNEPPEIEDEEPENEIKSDDTPAIEQPAPKQQVDPVIIPNDRINFKIDEVIATEETFKKLAISVLNYINYMISGDIECKKKFLDAAPKMVGIPFKQRNLKELKKKRIISQVKNALVCLIGKNEPKSDNKTNLKTTTLDEKIEKLKEENKGKYSNWLAPIAEAVEKIEAFSQKIQTFKDTFQSSPFPDKIEAFAKLFQTKEFEEYSHSVALVSIHYNKFKDESNLIFLIEATPIIFPQRLPRVEMFLTDIGSLVPNNGSLQEGINTIQRSLEPLRPK